MRTGGRVVDEVGEGEHVFVSEEDVGLLMAF
jgi:hypothetical protein